MDRKSIDKSKESNKVVLHLAQVKSGLTAQERRALAEKLADALLANKLRKDNHA